MSNKKAVFDAFLLTVYIYSLCSWGYEANKLVVNGLSNGSNGFNAHSSLAKEYNLVITLNI